MNYIDTALAFLEEGMNPIPGRETKAPALEQGHPFFHYKIDNVQQRFADVYCIGIAGGKVSGGMECIDFDHDDDTGESVASVFERYAADGQVAWLINEGKLSCYQTASGGFHIYLRSKYSEGSRKLATYESGRVMIETRGEGAYFIVHPSPGYNHVRGVELLKLSECDSAERQYLIDLAVSFSRQRKEHQAPGAGRWPERWDDTTAFGRFNNNEGESALRLLLAAGWQDVADDYTPRRERADGVVMLRRPGKDARFAVSATWGKFRNMFYVFSSNARPFLPQRAYTPADVFLHLKFGGDSARLREYVTSKYSIKVEQEQPRRVAFPVDVFPKDVTAFIGELERTLNFSPDFTGISVLFTFAALNGNKHKLKVKEGYIAPTIFWLMALGDPGVMKSHPIETMLQPLKNIDRASKAVYDSEVAEWEATEQKGKKPKFKQLLINDYTIEALHEAHAFNTRGLGLHKDEIVGFLNDMNKYRKGSDEQFWLESFNNKNYIINRVSKNPISIDNICINIIGSIQPQILSGVMKNFDGSGLIDRFLYTLTEDKIYPMTADEINPEWFTWWEGVLKAFNAHCEYYGEALVLTMTEEAFGAFLEVDKALVRMQSSDDESYLMKNYLSKIKTYIPRFALVLCLMDSLLENTPRQVLPDHITRAWRLASYFIASARYVFNETQNAEEISGMDRTMAGKTKAERIINLFDKGHKQAQIARQLKTPASYVSKVLKEAGK